MIAKTSSYTDTLPSEKCRVDVVVKVRDWQKNDCFKTEHYENAIYEAGFVSIDNGETYYFASSFLFHKLKREKID